MLSTHHNIQADIDALKEDIEYYKAMNKELIAGSSNMQEKNDLNLLILANSNIILEKEKQITVLVQERLSYKQELLNRETKTEPEERFVNIKWKNTSCRLALPLNASFDELVEIIVDKLGESLFRIDFALFYERTLGISTCISNDETFAAFLRTNVSIIKIESLATGFNRIDEQVVKDWANINEVIIDNSLFESVPIDEEDSALKVIIDHAMLDLDFKDELYGPISKCMEASVREYISVVLTASAIIAGDVKLSAERNIIGKRANGPVDYAMMYKKFFVLITEAKHDTLNAGIVQNIAQLVASREEYLYDSQPSKNKRKYMDFADQIAQVPSTGIVSTGRDWVLIRYVLYPEPKVTRSAMFSIPLEAPSKFGLRSSVTCLISKIVGAIKLQKDAIDSMPSSKEIKI